MKKIAYKFSFLLILLVFNVSLLACSPERLGTHTDEALEALGLFESLVGSGYSASLDDIPKYQGVASIAINGNKPFFEDSELTTDAFENYSPLDPLGRCGVAYANVCREIMPTEERGDIGSVKPSGWHTAKYNDLVEGNYLYNRCHLIAYSLAGENANEKNLITGTRYMNTTGMMEYEDIVREYVHDTGHHVLYRVTPIFEGSDLVARGVLMEAQSVEDNRISFCVYCYNVQPGIEIDYKTGESQVASIQPTVNNESNYGASGQYYVLNKNSKVFHIQNCSGVSKMSERNKESYSGTREDIINMGYSPCQMCRP